MLLLNREVNDTGHRGMLHTLRHCKKVVLAKNMQIGSRSVELGSGTKCFINPRKDWNKGILQAVDVLLGKPHITCKGMPPKNKQAVQDVTTQGLLQEQGTKSSSPHVKATQEAWDSQNYAACPKLGVGGLNKDYYVQDGMLTWPHVWL